MTTIATARPRIQRPDTEYLVDDAQLAAAAFLARYSGRTLDAYRHDLRGNFQWAADNQVPVLGATRPHIELYRSWMDQRGLAASTIASTSPTMGLSQPHIATDRGRPSTRQNDMRSGPGGAPSNESAHL